MRIIVANQKGGVGKTTLTAHLAYHLAHASRLPVCAIDADPQYNLTSYLLDNQRHPSGLLHAIAANIPITRAIVHSDAWHIDIIPSSYRTSHALSIAGAADQPIDTIATILQPLADRGHILIDTPPSRSPGYIQLLYAADQVIIPTTLERHSLEGVAHMAETLQTLHKRHGHTPALMAIVPTFARQTNEHRYQLAELIARFGTQVLAPIPLSIIIAEAASHGVPSFTYSPHNRAVTAMLHNCQVLAKEIL